MSSLPDLYSLTFNLKEKLKDIEPLTEKEPFLIGVCGGSASGKTSVCHEIVKELNDKKVAIVSQDWFYRPLTEKERENIDEYNFDSPFALDTETFVNVLTGLRKGETVTCPDYDFVSHSRTKKTHTVTGDVVLIEGILIFHCKELRELMHMKVFVDVDDDIRLARRIIRDTSERGRTLESVINQYFKHVKPGYDDYIAPMRKYADVIILRGVSNRVAIELFVERIKAELNNMKGSSNNNLNRNKKLLSRRQKKRKKGKQFETINSTDFKEEDDEKF